jgi:hypothetical protein
MINEADFIFERTIDWSEPSIIVYVKLNFLSSKFYWLIMVIFSYTFKGKKIDDKSSFKPSYKFSGFVLSIIL